MPLLLYQHPLASFCQKVLIALYENGTPFEARMVDLGDPRSRDEFLEIWPVGKIPVLRDEERERTIPETSIIIEYLDLAYPGQSRLIPSEAGQMLEVRLWDRFYDLHVQAPMQKIVLDRIQPEGGRDPNGVAAARAALRLAFAMIERRMADRRWAAGEDFTLADCAAAPAMFYATILEPLGPSHPSTAAYLERLLERPSVRRTLDEARPYFPMFPFADLMPERFRGPTSP